ncbi:MAG: hypothetical protein JWO10_1324 [Microbacteriaceae bacterium]|nr:hypothetical protein [Microbacteriaceae bacterium]
MRILFAILRVGIAAAIIAAIVGQLITSFSFWSSKGVEHTWINVTSFFSFFTIDSNVGTVVIGLVGAFYLLARKGTDPHWFNGFRAAIVTYMVVTGVVYNLLLRGIELPQGTTLAWSNEVLHVVAPAYLLLDWIFAPGRKPLSYTAVWGVVVFPIVWGVYTLIRGPITPDEVLKKDYWYPYPFMNPNTSPEGYFSVAFYIVMIAVLIGITAVGTVWVSKKRLLTEPLASTPASVV